MINFKHLLITLGLLLLPISELLSQALSQERAIAFLKCLSTNSPDILDFVAEDDLTISNRLGISYKGVQAKPLISWELTSFDKSKLQELGIDGQFKIEEIDHQHSELILFPTDPKFTKRWIFRGDYSVSSVLYHTSTWHTKESEHFRFLISDTTRFHPANIELLEASFTEIARLLKFTPADLLRIKKEKIIYCFCNSQEEIKQLTGYAPRGMYILSHDIIISTYSAHIHELAHLLMNYKLQNPSLFTHPLLLEGFAVAVGGRGGKTPEILNQLGLFLWKSEWVDMADFIAAQKFWGQNASISYPGSGAYVKFLIQKMGIDAFIKLYSKYGGNQAEISSMGIALADVPRRGTWKKYLKLSLENDTVHPSDGYPESLEGSYAFKPTNGGQKYAFALPAKTLVYEADHQLEFSSDVFDELLPHQSYTGAKYLIRSSESEIGVYDLYTNTMIGFYASAFSTAGLKAPSKQGIHSFQIDQDVFDIDIENCIIEFVLE